MHSGCRTGRVVSQSNTQVSCVLGLLETKATELLARGWCEWHCGLAVVGSDLKEVLPTSSIVCAHAWLGSFPPLGAWAPPADAIAVWLCVLECWCRLRLHWAACSSADVELDAACLSHAFGAFGASPAGRQWMPSWRCGSPVQQAPLLQALQTHSLHRTARRVEWG